MFFSTLKPCSLEALFILLVVRQQESFPVAAFMSQAFFMSQDVMEAQQAIGVIFAAAVLFATGFHWSPAKELVEAMPRKIVLARRASLFFMSGLC